MNKRFAITASDRYLAVYDAFVEAGWQPVKLFTTVADDYFDSNRAVVGRAQAQKIDIQLSRLNEAALQDLAARQCDLLVVASYPWRIEPWQQYLKYAINFHPSLLPRYRGPYPLVHALLRSEQQWGVTCHRVGEQFDTGEILAQREFPIDANDNHESLDLKTQMAMRQLAQQVAGNFEELWAAARPQGEGEYVGRWSVQERTLDFSNTVEQLDRQLRAFGQIECLATINEVAVHVARAVTWREAHQAPLGSVVHADGLRLVVACKDGYVAVLEWYLFQPGMASSSLRKR